MKNQGIWIFRWLSVLPLFFAVTMLTSEKVKSETQEIQQTSQETQRTAEDELLEQRVMSLSEEAMPSQKNSKILEMTRTMTLSEALSKLRAFNQIADGKTSKCVDSKKTLFDSKYVLSLDESGKPCRIYDLSFPNLKSLLTRKKASQVPIRRMTSKEYLNWLDGSMDANNENNEQYKKYFNPLIAGRYSWVRKLKFKNRPEAVPGSKESFFDLGLPQSFSLADLDLGNDFSFNYQLDNEFQTDTDEFVPEYLLKVMKNPETFLQGIRFNWNDFDKVYDVVLDASFLPIKGPVALVDYQRPYKFAVEKMIRAILSTGLIQLSKKLPNKMISTIVEVAVSDTFEQLDFMYEYQMLQLEDSLKTLAINQKTSEEELFSTNLALNVLYGQRSDLFSNYIQSVIQKKEFDWQAFDKMGKAARYGVEKQREISMGKMNSRLVLEKKCEVEFFQDYFAICFKNGQKDALYSLISTQSMAVKNFGAPMIFRYDRPYETTLFRGGTWVLSIALRIIGLPLSRTVTYKLDSILKNYMHSGLMDEALLKNNLTHKKQLSGLAMENESLLKWLFIQNLNPFLPKTQASENSLIEINRQLLGF